jgi:hypothetical protein
LQFHANQAGLVTGHDFSRAENATKEWRALAPADFPSRPHRFFELDSVGRNKIDIHLPEFSS